MRGGKPGRPARRVSRRREWRRWLRIGLVAAALLGVSSAGLALDIYRFSFQSDPAPADAAIVLGAAVWDGQPSPVFKERINHALDLYRSGQIQAIIFTGGVGINDQLAEAVVAKAYAVANGVPAEDIFCENSSRFTWANLQGAQAIAHHQAFERVLIVSDPLHMRRAVWMARDLGMDAYPSPTPTTRFQGRRSRLKFLFQETYSFVFYLVQKQCMAALQIARLSCWSCRAIRLTGI